MANTDEKRSSSVRTAIVPLKNVTKWSEEYGTAEELLNYEIDPVEERALRRAIDLQVGPIVMIL